MFSNLILLNHFFSHFDEMTVQGIGPHFQSSKHVTMGLSDIWWEKDAETLHGREEDLMGVLAGKLQTYQR
jgi:hypothetical protein